MPDLSELPRITISETIQGNSAVAVNLSQEFSMDGARDLIVMEELESSDDPTISEIGTEFTTSNTSDKDLLTSENEVLSVANGDATGIWDFGSIASRDLFIKYKMLETNSNNTSATLHVTLSDDNSTYGSDIHTDSDDSTNDEHLLYFPNESFRYVKMFFDWTGSGNSINATVHEVASGAQGTLVLEIKDEIQNTWKTLYTFPTLSSPFNGEKQTQITNIRNVLPNITLPNASGLLRFTAVQPTNRFHSVRIMKVF